MDLILMNDTGRGIIYEEWMVQLNDLVGDWCITLKDAPTPAEGTYVIGHFMERQVAEHMVEVHNEWFRLINHPDLSGRKKDT